MSQTIYLKLFKTDLKRLDSGVERAPNLAPNYFAHKNEENNQPNPLAHLGLQGFVVFTF